MGDNAGKRFGNKRVLRDDQITHYSFPDLLPPDHVLALNRKLGLLSHLAPGTDEENWPHLLEQEQFSQNEGRILFPLLENHPHFCPHEALLASFYTGQITEEALNRSRLRLQEAQFAGVWDYEMRPVRNVLSRVRFKLRAFRIDIRSILETGYVLKLLEDVTALKRREDAD